MINSLIDTLFPDCRKVFLRDFSLPVRIGIHDFEKSAPQRLIINIDLFVSLAQSTPLNDDINEVFDYDFMRETVIKRVAQGHIHLQETLCDDLCSLMLAHPHVRAVRISTQKPDVYPDCAAVGVEVLRIRS